MNVPIFQPPDDLISSLQEHDCILFAGPGLSNIAGSPTMRAVLESLLDFAGRRGLIDESFGKLLQTGLAEGQDASVAEALVSRTWHDDAPPAEVGIVLKDMFSTLEPTRLPRVYGRLRQIPFGAVVTTNIDDFLRRTFQDRLTNGAYTSRDAEQLKAALSKRAFFLLQLHGTISDPATLLLSDSQYAERLSSDLPLAEFLQTLCMSRTHLFIGSSFEGIESYLSGTSARLGHSRPHFALLYVSGESWRLRADALQHRYNLRVIPYSEEPHRRVISSFTNEIIARLAIKSSRDLPRASTGSPIEHIQKIRVENIGPFSRLSLELNSGWNVLLGGNGLGKSSLLRAIAVALCGEQSPKDVTRLIKSGQTSAIVALTLGKREIVCEIKRSGGSDAEIKSFPPRPLESVGRLAIAFPALRSTTRAVVPGPRPSDINRPHAADLLPLLKGDTDNRFDDIKQWLVNLDYKIKDAISKGTKNPGERQILDGFFHVIGQLTKGIRLEFVGVDPSTNEVSVRTHDGIVSLDLVSQGTASLIGWIGYLLQRQFDISANAAILRREPAIVLIDELDAHMHPLWQRLLVEQLKSLFPNVQFLVTTHSPLIVAGLSPSEIVSFRRTDDHIAVEHPFIDTRGLRADQLLTSPLFGLDGTRDLEIDRQIERYADLAAQETLDADEKAEVSKLAETLQLRLPSDQEREDARSASALIEAAVRDRLQRMSPDERSKVVRELQIQVQEAITGSRRPT